MVSKKVTIVNEMGLHMRLAGDIVKAVKAHPGADVRIRSKNKEVKASSVMQIMMAGIKKGDEAEVIVSGSDEQAVLDELVTMIQEGFGKE